MALPVLEKTWSYDVNNVAGSISSSTADRIDFLFGFVNKLIAGGWVVVGSCDSVACHNSDGINRILAAVNWVISGGGGGSWITLKNSAIATNAMLLIGREFGGTHFTIKFSLTGFGALYGGADGTTGTLPTASYSVTLVTGADDFFPLAGGGFQVTYHLLMSSDLECTRLIVTDASTIPVGIVYGYMAIEKPKNPTSEWVNPVILTAVVRSSTSFNVPQMTTARLCNDVASVSILGTSSISLRFTSEGAGNTPLCDWTSIPQSDDASTSWPMFPIGVSCITLGSRNWNRGELYDMWFGSYQIPTGDTYPTTVGQKRKFIQIGRVIFPWDGHTIVDGTAIDLS